MLPKIIENRQLILQSPEVLKNLTEIDLIITEKGTNILIKDIPKQEAVKILTEMSSKILLDLGVKNADPYEVIRFADIVIKYYKRFSVNEIKLAFELLLVGELDLYLPKDKYGNADKNHYQSFSAQYISRVLQAYAKRRDKTWHKAYKALPIGNNKPTDEDRKKSRDQFIENIKNTFTLYKEKKEKINISIPTYWVYFLNKRGFIKVTPDLSKETIQSVFSKILQNNIFVPDKDKLEIERDFKKDKIHPTLLRKSEHQYYYDLIYEFFDYVIKNKKDLNKLL